MPNESISEDSEETGSHTSSQVFEIDLAKQVEKLWNGRRIIIITTALFTFIGFFHYTFGPEDYLSESILIHEYDSAGGGLTGGGGGNLLQSLAGINIQGAGAGNIAAAARGRAPLPITLYPSIVNSTDFQKQLINEEIEFATLNRSMTLLEYFSDYHSPPLRDRVYSFIGDVTIFLPNTLYREFRRATRNIRGFVSGSGGGSSSGDSEQIEVDMESPQEVEVIDYDDRLLLISRDELRVIDNMRNRIALNSGSALTEIAVELPDPKASAIVNAMLIERIQQYMTDYRIEKAQQNLEYVLVQHENAKERYEEAQRELAKFRDENINLSTATAQIQEQHLSDQRSLRFEVYRSISEEVEQARLSLQQEIPVFNVLEKPNVPQSPDTGASDLIFVFSIVLGFFIGVGVVMVKANLRY